MMAFRDILQTLSKPKVMLSVAAFFAALVITGTLLFASRTEQDNVQPMHEEQAQNTQTILTPEPEPTPAPAPAPAPEQQEVVAVSDPENLNVKFVDPNVGLEKVGIYKV